MVIVPYLNKRSTVFGRACGNRTPLVPYEGIVQTITLQAREKYWGRFEYNRSPRPKYTYQTN
jgi:hypothetical protein